MESNQIRQSVRDFIANFVRTREFADEENIFQAGFVNSLFAMQLILFVENTFAVSVENEDMDIANFCSVDALTRFVLSKQGADATA
ncbi:hypothetical protein JWH16_13285 [Xanthomonas campestris pv. campestris]|uniref:acyl carrier protein n=1 Tax=Xanthomonas campestris TaxID=339 RepID=UPI001E645B2F|nr:hypothetical protein [Xanthomonas campestris]MCD0254762.1 hypothetical protein [Xanthomonas campestris pv. campestris]MEB1300200.1 hypothetical protein [Xanthomonas campestris pv. campestris]MEB1308994.1 hypothetical protein [Xanthomonas campestris pv. campestris]MEB1334075.1 hypothetical protein [Xanthomonas campestris pv. campestris]MEB1899963.1 hypothetical protein [Xanthomonas campestris pv. campestris]